MLRAKCVILGEGEGEAQPGMVISEANCWMRIELAHRPMKLLLTSFFRTCDYTEHKAFLFVPWIKICSQEIMWQLPVYTPYGVYVSVCHIISCGQILIWPTRKNPWCLRCIYNSGKMYKYCCVFTAIIVTIACWITCEYYLLIPNSAQLKFQ